MYFNFNYTKSLEKYYQIPVGNILHIHGKVQLQGGTLVLGHGIDPKEFDEADEQPPKNATPEVIERWYECKGDQYDHSFELGKQEMLDYFVATFKPTETIIRNNQEFFNKIEAVEEIFILGHSLSDVDMPYIEKIKDSIKPNTIWTVSHYGYEEYCSHKSTLISIGIKEQFISVIPLDSMILKT